MSSSALVAWSTSRRARINQLRTAHSAVGGTGPGRRWQTEQLNWSLILRVAAEFQGFARDLHDLGVETFVGAVAGPNTPLESVLRDRLTTNRQLDTGNAHPGSLGNDFGRFGMSLWPTLETLDTAAPQWNADLTALNDARNAIAHAQESRIDALRSLGYPPTLKTVSRWVSTLDRLSGTMDRAVAAHLPGLLAIAPPW